MPLSGNSGTVKKGAATHNVVGWTYDSEGMDADGTTTEDLGNDHPIAVGVKNSGTIDYFYEAASGLIFAANETVTLELNLPSSHKLVGPALIGKISLKSKTKELITLQATWKSTGAFVYS